MADHSVLSRLNAIDLAVELDHDRLIQTEELVVLSLLRRASRKYSSLNWVKTMAFSSSSAVTDESVQRSCFQ